MRLKELSIITISYNSYELIENWLNSLIENPPHCDYEVLIVDNGSSETEREKLKNKIVSLKSTLPIKFFLLNNNLGFAKANNIAFKYSAGEFLLFVNNDTIFFEHTIDDLLEFIKSDNEIGVVGPKILSPDLSFQPQSKRGIPTLWSSFCYFSGLYKIFPNSKFFGNYLQTFVGEEDIAEVPAVSGACMLVRRRVFEDVGGFNEEYFMHFEDIEFCLQAKNKGFKVVYYPNSQIVHFKGGSSKKSPVTKLYFYNSMLKFYERNLKKHYNFMFNWIVKRIILLLIWKTKRKIS